MPLFTFYPVHAIAALLREHKKDAQAELILRGELIKLDLNCCHIGDPGAESLAEFFKGDATVKNAVLWGCNIGPRGAEAIADALKHNDTLCILHLPQNDFGDEGAHALIDALSHNVAMKKLSVTFGTGMADESRATIDHLSQTRNEILIPAAVQKISFLLIAARCSPIGAGDFSVFPKEIVKMIAMQVWATRKDPIWIQALSVFERTGEMGD